MRKGISELESGCVVPDDFKSRGRKPAEARLPALEKHLRSMAEALSQTDPTFRATQLYRRLTGKEARRRLIEDFGYSEADAPSERSLRRKLSALGYQPMKVRKSKPLRKIRETDAIECGLERLEGLGKWFVKFLPAKVSAALKSPVACGF